MLRTTLALMVMVFHLWLPFYPIGIYPVFGFFVISGYLMTLIMHEGYGYTSQGRSTFIVNRFLRLYPQYWASALLSVVLIYVLGDDFHPAMHLPQSVGQAASNLSLMFVAWRPNMVTPRLSPATWALTVELFFYALICLGASRTLCRVYVWIVLSLSYVVVSYALGWGWQDRYFPIAAGSLPFAIGALIYHLPRREIPARPLFLLMLVNTIFWCFVPGETGFYLNLAICSLLVYSIASGGLISGLSRQTDRAIGDYSYPIYILHWQAGWIASVLIFGEPVKLSAAVLAGAGLAVVCFSALFIRFIDTPVQTVRARLKSR